MNFQQLVTRISDLEKLPYNTCRRMAHRLFDEMRLSLCEKDSVRVKGFGTFNTVTTPAKEIRLPGGTKVQAEERQRIKFVPSTKLKQDING